MSTSHFQLLVFDVFSISVLSLFTIWCYKHISLGNKKYCYQTLMFTQNPFYWDLNTEYVYACIIQ